MKTILKNITNSILITVFVAYVIIAGYFIANIYNLQINQAEKNLLKRLQSISNTLSVQMNGTMLKMLMEMYPERNDIYAVNQDNYYRKQYEILRRAAELNELPTDIYTLTYDSLTDNFVFGVTSGENPYFRHVYADPPEELKKNYKNGGVVHAYEDENGVWLSAFSPVKDAEGEVSGVIQVDLPFQQFIADARMSLFKNVLFALVILTIVGGILYYFLKKILDEEESIKKDLEKSNIIIKKRNKDITDSIRYARKIQKTILPDQKHVNKHFPNSFVLYLPKDIVSGDFYYYRHFQMNGSSKHIIAAIDCTGHGVPGAFLSLLGNNLMNSIVGENPNRPANQILMELNKRLIDSFKRFSEERSTDGMDVALCVVDEAASKISFSGAFRPLFYIQNEELKVINGDKHPVGGDHYEYERKYTLHEIDCAKDDVFYIFSDGYVDQFGGANQKKFMTKNFKNLLLSVHKESLEEQFTTLKKAINDWKQDEEQVDDITVVGFRV